MRSSTGVIGLGLALISALIANAASASEQNFIRVSTDYHPANVYHMNLELDANGNAIGVHYRVTVDGKPDPKLDEYYTIASLKGNGKVLLHQETKDIIRLILDSDFDSVRGGTGRLVYIQNCNGIGFGCKYPQFEMAVDHQGNDFVVRNPQTGVFNRLYLKMEDDGRNGVGHIEATYGPIND